MPDLELEVPQPMEHGAGDSFLFGSWRFFGQEHQIEVAVRRHFPASGPAEPDNYDPGIGTWRGFGDVIEGEADELVVEEGDGPRGLAAMPRRLGQAARNFRSPSREPFGQDCGHV